MQNTLTTAAEAAIAGRGPRLVMVEGEGHGQELHRGLAERVTQRMVR